MIEKKEEYVARLYDELFTPHHEFCMGLNWLSEEALASDASNRFEQMWKILVWYFEISDCFPPRLLQHPWCRG